MNIAHITTENPFKGHGGLSAYVRDILYEQLPNHQLLVIFPGTSSLFSNKIFLKTYRHFNIKAFEIMNPVPATFLEGCAFPELEINNEKLNKIILHTFIRHKIELVHFHTFIGLNSTLLKILHKHHIKTCYTAHDYQPLCPKITLLDFEQKICTDINKGLSCCHCNQHALSTRSFKIRNSFAGNYLKKFDLIKGLIKSIMFNKYSSRSELSIDYNKSNQYEDRRIHYIKMFNKYLNRIIVSSNLSYSYFQKLGITTAHTKILMANKSISNKIVKFPSHVKSSPKIGYIGGYRVEKGFQFLISELDKFCQTEKTSVELIVTGSGSKNIVCSSKKIVVKNYGYISRKNLYSLFDILIVPSIWPETFGLVVPEALSNGKIVLASCNVGSANELFSENLLRYESKTDFSHQLKKSISMVNKQSSPPSSLNLLWDNHVESLRATYQHILNEE